MIPVATGDFGANFNLPTALRLNTTNTSSRLINNFFVGDRTYINVNVDSSDFPWLASNINDNSSSATERTPNNTNIYG